MSADRAFTKDPVSHSLGIVGVLSVVQRVVGVGRSIVFARALGPEQIGLYNLTAFVLSLGIPLVTFGLASAYGRYVPRYEANRSLRAFMRVTTATTVTLTLGFVVLAWIFARPLTTLLLGDARSVWAFRITLLTLLPAVLHRNLSSFFKGLLAFRLSAFIEFAYLGLFTLLGVGAVLLWRPRLDVVLWTNLAAYLLPVLFFGTLTWRFLVRLPDQRDTVDEEQFTRKMFRFCVWFVVIPSGLTLFDYVDRLMLTHFLDVRTVGIYSQAFTTTSFLLALGYVPNLVLGPTLSAAWERRDLSGVQRTFNTTLKLMLLLMLGASVVLVVLKRWILVTAYGVDYADGARVMAPLLAFQCFDVTYSIAGMYSGLVEKTYLPALAVGTGLAVNVGLNVLLIPAYGMPGAAYAAMLSYALINVVLYALNRRTGLHLGRSTQIVCALPFALLLPVPFLLAVAAATLVLVCATDRILDAEEKADATRVVLRLVRLPFAAIRR